MIVELQVDSVLGLVEDVAVLHDAGEYVAVGKKWPFWYSDAIACHFAVLWPFLNSAHEGVNLEGEAPSVGILVVHVEQVNVFVLSDILPLGERFI